MSADELIAAMNAYYYLQAPWHDEFMNFTSFDHMEKHLAPIFCLFKNHIKDRDILEIACGTGNWTGLLARTARSVTATDINSSVLDIARAKLKNCPNVTFREIDAYTIGRLRGRFHLAFAADWYSHIPLSKISPFLNGLHQQLISGGRVIFMDMLNQEVFDKEKSYFDEEGNRVALRRVPDGSEFWVIKNFPTEDQLRREITSAATDIAYYRHTELKRWLLMYILKP